MYRTAPILPAKFMEKYDGKSKEQNSGNFGKKDFILHGNKTATNSFS